MAVAVHSADVQDRDGARLALMRLVGRFPRGDVPAAAGNLLDEAAAVVGAQDEELRG